MTPDKFWSKVEKSEGCWLWTGAKNRHGYGNVWVDSRYDLAHRYAYRLSFGTIPEGLWVLHHCDNPTCVRPDHLFVGTCQINADDKAVKGRAAKVLTVEKVAEIRRLYATGRYRQVDLSRLFGVHQTGISRIIRRDVFKHI